MIILGRSARLGKLGDLPTQENVMNQGNLGLDGNSRADDARKWLKREWDALAHPLSLIRAVICTYEMFRRQGKTPGSEVLYANNEAYFTAHALPLIRQAWAKETKRDPLEFP